MLILFSLFFFFSGVAGLIYEVLWMRQFGLVMGNTTISLSAVLTAFMGGLAIGSWLGGRLADRRQDHLKLYGAFELGIGAYALVLPSLILMTRPLLSLLYQNDPNSILLISARFIFALLIMIVPTICMGATLPLLIKHFTVRGEDVGKRTGFMYAINSFGAMAGAYLAGFHLIPWLGMKATNLSAALINIIIGVLAISISWKAASNIEAQAPPTTEEDLHWPVATRAEARAALIGIAISGMAAMIYQVCWTRLFALLIGSSVYSFSMVVVANIGGLALGGLIFGRVCDRAKRPLWLFVVIQILAAASCYAIVYFSQYYPAMILRMLMARQGNYGLILFYEFSFILLLLIVPTFLMGGMFPVATRVCAGELRKLGRTIGSVYAYNTAGAVAGSLTGGLVFMRLFGLWNAVMVAVALNLGAAMIALLSLSHLRSVIRWGMAVVLIASTIAVFAMPSQWNQAILSIGAFYVDRFQIDDATQEALQKQATFGDLVYYRDSLAGTVTVRNYTRSIPNRVLAMNGKVEASTNLGDMPTQLLCGYLGYLSNPKATDAMVIGLGAGVSLSALTQIDSLKSIDMVEISEAVVEAVRQQFSSLSLHALDDPRVHLILGDGRNHVLLSRKQYDIIASEPSNPWVAGISNLFTREFFEGCRDRLKPGGVMVQWIHSYNMSIKDFRQVVYTFMSVMPEATLWEVNDGDFLLVGSTRPLKWDWKETGQLLSQPKITKHLQAFNLEDPRILSTAFMANKQQILATKVFSGATVNEDDTCELEFSAPRSFYNARTQAGPWDLFQFRHSPVACYEEKTLPDAIGAELEKVPEARRILLTAFATRQQPTIAKACEQAVALSPYDPLTRRRAIEFYLSMAEDGFRSQFWENCHRWALHAVDLLQPLNSSLNAWQQGTLFRMLYISSQKLGDQPRMQMASQNLERLGGKHYRDVMTKESVD